VTINTTSAVPSAELITLSPCLPFLPAPLPVLPLTTPVQLLARIAVLEATVVPLPTVRLTLLLVAKPQTKRLTAPAQSTRSVACLAFVLRL